MLPADRFRSQIADGLAGIGVAVAAISWLAPVIATSTPIDRTVELPWAIPMMLTAVALALVTLRLRSDDHPLADLVLTGVATTTLGLLVALELPSIIVAVGAVTVLPIAVFVSRRMDPVVVYLPAVWAVLAIVDIDESAGLVHLVSSISLLAVLVVMITALRSRRSFDNHWIGWFEMSAVTAVAAAAATDLAPDHVGTAVLAAAAVTIALVNLIERRYTGWALAALVLAGVVSADAATTTVLADSYWIGWAIATVSLAAVWFQHRSSIVAHAMAAAAVLTAATATVVLDVSPEQFIGLSMLATAGLTGVALALHRRTPLDAAALTAGAILLLASAFDVDAAWISAIWVMLGFQIACAGVALPERRVAIAGLAVSAVAMGSWWFTSGLNDWFLDVIAPFDVTAGDLWAAGLSIITLVAGIAVRRTLQVNSWFAYSGSLAISCLWLTSVQLERSTDWALPLALTIGIVAVGLGAWHRLAAALVGGTLFTTVTIFVAAGSDLNAIPGWAWLATGGLALLGLAVLIERGGKQGVAGLKELVDRWQ
jgi:hypothetical protein